MKHCTHSSPSCIEPGILYHLSEFMTRLGWGKHAMRSARNKGLKVRDLGGKRYIHADDFFAFLDRLDEQGTPLKPA